MSGKYLFDMRRLVFIVFALMVALVSRGEVWAVTGVSAQTPVGWQVTEQCAATPAKLPPDWTFNGTIMLTGWAGIHGVHQDWETPHVLSFGAFPYPSRYGLYHNFGSSVFSPNQLWYAAMPTAYDCRPGAFSCDVLVNGIQVSSTTHLHEQYELPMFDLWYRAIDPSYSNHMRWWDNQTLIYRESGHFFGDSATSPVLINAFSGEVVAPWKGMPEVISDPSIFAQSPDWTRTVYSQLSAKQVNGVYDPLSGEKIAALPEQWLGNVSWSPQSHYFLMGVFDDAGAEAQASETYSLFGRDGNHLDTFFQVSDANEKGLSLDGWSADERYFAFNYPVSQLSQPIEGTLYIADREQKTIRNTCIAVDGDVWWSPTDLQLAVIEPGKGQRRVQVMDLNTWELYSVAYHDGDIVGWREGD